MGVDFKNTDRQIYEQELEDFLPDKIFDAHVHLFDESCVPEGYEFPTKSCYRKFDCKFTMEDYLGHMDKMLPGHELHLNHFGHPSPDFDLDASARYTGKVSDNKKYYGMSMVSPHDKISNIRKRILDNRLVGYKPYLDFVDWKKPIDVTIHDMLPAGQMRFADERGLAVVLHIPRSGRLTNPLNQKQMVDICRRYPGAKIIFAHIGRAYYLKNVVGFLDGIAECPNAYLDTAMVNHEGVLEYTFRNFPIDRILFGSDAPIALLRGKSVEINNQYAYLMGEDYEIGTAIYDANHAVDFTFFFYEQIRGIKLASLRAGLSKTDIKGIFFNNANSLFSQIAKQNFGK
jgi:hypothetical protein